MLVNKGSRLLDTAAWVQGTTPLHVAASGGHLEFVCEMLKAEEDEDVCISFQRRRPHPYLLLLLQAMSTLWMSFWAWILVCAP